MPSNDTMTAETIQQILAANAMTPEPEVPPVAGEDMPILTNWEWIENSYKPKKRGLPLPVICEQVYNLTDSWPKRVGDLLFVRDDGYRPRYLETAAELFAWFDAQFFVDWARGSDMVSPERFLAHLQATAQQFDAVEQYPHWPALPRTYYMHPPLPATDGTYLDALVNFFNPLTPVDRKLIRAFVMGLAFGGPPGSRPAWLFTAPSDDPQAGRGVGKSKLIELASELVGGMIEISDQEDIIAVKKRLLSPNARTLRVCRLDNIKRLRFSWADLEALITSQVISGHRLYHGEGRRPNTLTWTLTLNGASLSKDMAKRAIVVKLERPQYGPNWEQEARHFIEAYRWHIINDIGLLLTDTDM
jgi:hypothetical protein